MNVGVSFNPAIVAEGEPRGSIGCQRG